MKPHPTVFVIDDDASARQSLTWLLQSVNLTVKEFDSAEAYLSHFDPEAPGCILLDLRMSGMGGLALLQHLTAREISPPVILVSAYATVSTTTRAMRTGAVNVLEKPYDDQDLLDAIQEALRRDEIFRTEHAQRAQARARLDLLTPREREVLDLIVKGLQNKGIARQLQVSEKNVEYHRANVYRKLAAGNLSELIRTVLTANGHGPK